MTIHQPLSAPSSPQHVFFCSSSSPFVDHDNSMKSKSGSGQLRRTATSNANFFAANHDQHQQPSASDRFVSPSYAAASSSAAEWQFNFSLDVIQESQPKIYEDEQGPCFGSCAQSSSSPFSPSKFVARTDYWHSMQTMKRSYTVQSDLSKLASDHQCDDMEHYDEQRRQQEEEDHQEQDQGTLMKFNLQEAGSCSSTYLGSDSSSSSFGSFSSATSTNQDDDLYDDVDREAAWEEQLHELEEEEFSMIIDNEPAVLHQPIAATSEQDDDEDFFFIEDE